MAYVPNPTDVTQPVDSVFASTAAAEFRALKAYIAGIVSGGGPGAPTPGQVVAFPGITPPAGWLVCDGSLVSRTTYAALYAAAVALGNVVSEATWAASAPGAFSVGDGATTFRLPDLRGVFLRGWANGKAGLTFDGARAEGSIQAASFVFNQGGAGAAATVPVTTNSVYNSDGDTGQNLSYTAGITGSSGTSSQTISAVRPVNVALMYCIKT